MKDESELSPAVCGRVVSLVNGATNQIVNVMVDGGRILVSSDPARIGTIHEGARRILAGEVEEIAIDAETARNMQGVRPGYNGAVWKDGRKVACIGVSGDPAVAKPVQKTSRPDRGKAVGSGTPKQGCPDMSPRLRIRTAVLAGFLAAMAGSCAFLDIPAGQPGTARTAAPDAPRVLEIRDAWKRLQPRYAGNPYEAKPSWGFPYKAGSLHPGFIQDGTNMVNFARFLAGLPADVRSDEKLAVQAQHGAVLLMKHGSLDHKPPKPRGMPDAFYKLGLASTGSSNIHQSIGTISTLADAVFSFLDDSDPSNIDRLGHRRWVLNPHMGSTAFGHAGDGRVAFVTMQAFDSSRKGGPDYDFVAWPAPGWFPSSFMAPAQAWSVSPNPARYDPARSKPTVRLARAGDGRTWTFGAGVKGAPGAYFNVDRMGFGIPFCVIFRPEGIPGYAPGSRYSVRVEGLADKAGKPAVIEFEVEFFRL